MSDLESIISNDTIKTARTLSSDTVESAVDGVIIDSSNNQAVTPMQSNEYPSLMNHILEHLTTVAHCCLFGYAAFVLFLGFKGPVVLFTWHPILLSLGWLLFMTEAVLMLSKNNIFARRLSQKLRVRSHLIIQDLAIALAVSGFVIVIVNKENNNSKHFTSWHGFMGLLSIIFLIPMALTGLPALFNVELRNYINPKLNKFIHATAGIITVTLGGITIILSLQTGWFRRETKSSEPIYYIAFTCITFGILWSLLRPLINFYKRLKSF